MQANTMTSKTSVAELLLRANLVDAQRGGRGLGNFQSAPPAEAPAHTARSNSFKRPQLLPASIDSSAKSPGAGAAAEPKAVQRYSDAENPQIPAARGKPAYTLQQLAEWDLPGDDFAAAAPFPAPGLARADTIGPRLELGSLANHSLELTSLATHKNTYSSLVKPASSSSSLSSPPPARRYEVYGIGPAPALAVLVARYWVTDAEDAAPVTPEAAARAAAGVADSLARLTAQAASKRAVFSSQALVGVADGRGGWAAVGWGCGPRPGAAARYARQRRQWKAAVAVGGTTQAASTAAAGVAARSLLALPSPPPCAAASPGQASSALSSPPSCAAYASSAEEMTPVTSEGVHWRGNPAATAAASAPLAAGAAVLLLPAADLAQLSLRPAKRSASYEARDSSSHDDGKVAAFSCWGGLRKRSAGAGRRLLGRLRLGGRSVSPV